MFSLSAAHGSPFFSLDAQRTGMPYDIPEQAFVHALLQQAPFHRTARARRAERLKRLLSGNASAGAQTPGAVHWPDDTDDVRITRERRARYPRKRAASLRRRGAQHPAALDGRYRRVFPLRDQDNQLFVHRELAWPADRTKVDPELRLIGVSIDEGYAGTIREDIAAGLFPRERHLVEKRFRKLRAGLFASLEKAARGEEPVPPDEVYVRALARSDLAPGEEALEGQYGLFNRRNAGGKWRSVSEGAHLCFFSGFQCPGPDEYEAECRRHPREEIDAYALVIGADEYPCILPYQGGDLGQFANSALMRDARGKLMEDAGRTNTRFACANVAFEDHRPGGHGRRLSFPVIFLYMLAAPADDGKLEREARVWYGQAYWDAFK